MVQQDPTINLLLGLRVAMLSFTHSADNWAATRRLPDGLTHDGSPMVFLPAACVAAMARTRRGLEEDLRFEHLADADAKVWAFASHCLVEPHADHIATFLNDHAIEPQDRTCFLPIEHLEVVAEVTVLGLRLLPLADDRVPSFVHHEKLAADAGCAVAVEVRGTNLVRMAERARQEVRGKLSVLRFSLRAHHSIADEQLRFRLGIAYAFGGGAWGWRSRSDVAWKLTIGSDLAAFAEDAKPAQLTPSPVTDLQARLRVALDWLDRTALTGEPLTALLYAFFALEALLGDKSEGLKAHGLAFRQTMLSHEVEGSFSDPNRTWLLYDEVRSAAVHGEPSPDLSWEDVERFVRGVRRTLRQVSELAQREGIQKRAGIRRFLEGHPDRSEFEDWIRRECGPEWDRFFNRL